MRLIDADRLIKLLKEQKVKETGAYTKGINSGLNVAKCIINDNTVQSPTAYDIEKVAEKLEDLEPFHVDGYGDDFVNLYDAIEIVKQGGIGTDDVCEWKGKEKEFIQNPHTKRLYSNEESMKNVYCNTCGKKIKVVEKMTTDIDRTIEKLKLVVEKMKVVGDSNLLDYGRT